MIWICLLTIFMGCSPVYSAEEEVVGLLQDQPKLVQQSQELPKVEEQSKVVEQAQEQAQPKSNNELDEFIVEEEKKIKNIKLLSLDLEKANILLKQKEIESKMAALVKDSVGLSSTSPLGSAMSADTSKRLVALTLTKDFKEALIEVNGRASVAHEGDLIGSGKVSLIHDQGVSIVYPDGTEEQLTLRL